MKCTHQKLLVSAMKDYFNTPLSIMVTAVFPHEPSPAYSENSFLFSNGNLVQQCSGTKFQRQQNSFY